jgi:GT2 family glycosyltransferase
LNPISRKREGGSSHAPLVVIGILNWNGWRNTTECLESVYNQEYPNFLAVVVDNGSWDGSADRLRRWAIERLGDEAAIAEYDAQMALSGGRKENEDRINACGPRKRLVLIHSRENLGWAGGNNLVAAYALSRKETRFVFFLNNDVVADPHSLSILVSAGSNFRKVVLAPGQQGPRGDNAPARLSLSRLLFAPLVNPGRPGRDTGRISDSEVVSGAAMLVSREVLNDPRHNEGEWFSSKIFLYWEDQLFCHLARKHGSVVGHVRDAVVRHKGSASSGGSVGPLLFYYRERGKVFAANAALPVGMRALFHLLNPLLCLARAAKYAVTNPACARAALWGLVDGLRGVGGKWRDHDRLSHPLDVAACSFAEREER